MFSIITSIQHTASGTPKVLAKGHGRQKTISYDHSKSHEANYGAAAGALLNLLTTDLQQAKVKHPSGGQRVHMDSLSDAGGKMRFTIDV